MQNESMPARGVPIVPAEPVGRGPSFATLLRGDWVMDGGRVERRGEYAVLTSAQGIEVLLDERAVRLAAMALGVEIKR